MDIKTTLTISFASIVGFMLTCVCFKCFKKDNKQNNRSQMARKMRRKNCVCPVSNNEEKENHSRNAELIVIV